MKKGGGAWLCHCPVQPTFGRQGGGLEPAEPYASYATDNMEANKPIQLSYLTNVVPVVCVYS